MVMYEVIIEQNSEITGSSVKTGTTGSLVGVMAYLNQKPLMVSRYVVNRVTLVGVEKHAKTLVFQLTYDDTLLGHAYVKKLK